MQKVLAAYLARENDLESLDDWCCLNATCFWMQVELPTDPSSRPKSSPGPKSCSYSSSAGARTAAWTWPRSLANTSWTHYCLVAAVAHIGETANSGHYIAFIRQAVQWWRLDDERIEASALAIPARSLDA